MGKAKKAAKRAAKADKAQAHAATRKSDGPLLAAAGSASELADQPPLVALSVGTIVVGAALRRPAVVRSGVRMLVSHALATGAKTLVKNVVDRTRPSRALREGHRIGKGDGAEDTSLNSMPSGHTAGAVAVAQAVAAESTFAGVPAQLAAIGVGMLQPRRGKHYLSDVVVGAAIGWAAERVTDAVMRTGVAALRRRAAKLEEEEAAAHPS